MAKRPVPLYDFKAFGAAIKAARKEYGESRKKVSDELYISPRYLANIENKGQQPSLQVFYDLVTRYHISVDQFFFPNSNAEKSTGRRQLDALLDGMSDKGICRNTFSRFSSCRIFFFPSSISACNSSRFFSLGFVMGGHSFLPVGTEKGQSISSAVLLIRVFGLLRSAQ